MSALNMWLSVHAFATVFMTGLIWTIQLLHYPLFEFVGEARFERYSRLHVRRITWIAGPMMLLEAAAATLVAGFIRAVPSVAPLAWSGLLLLAVIWVSTLALQGPLNARLTGGFDRALIRRLVVTNWIRTVCWSARAVIALLLFVRAADR